MTAKVTEEQKVNDQRGKKSVAELPDGENTCQCTEAINSLKPVQYILTKALPRNNR